MIYSKLVYVIILLLQLTVGQMVCSSGQTYVKFRVKCTTFADEQSFRLHQGAVDYYSSPMLSENELRVLESCMTTTPNSQYTLKMFDEYGDSWSTGSWLEIIGLYGNVVFKNYMIEKSFEIFIISLYYGVKQNQEWRATIGATEGWTVVGFQDSQWQLVTLQSTIVSLIGSQYFRIPFTGIDKMASFEARFRYRTGIVAFINGQEIFRDNMPSGVISSSTPASGNYQSVDFRGLIRSAISVSETHSVLAVEVHYLESTSENTITFDSFLAINAASVHDKPCSIIPIAVTITSTPSVATASNLFDFGKLSTYTTSMSISPVINFLFDANVRPVLNGLNIWPGSAPTLQAKDFTFGGSHDNNALSVFTPIINVKGQLYESLKIKQTLGFFNTGYFKHYRLTVIKGVSNNLSINELMPMICNIPPPTSIIYDMPAYSFYALYHTVDIAPTISGFTGCFILPTLPTGTSIDPNTCIISGISSVQTNSIVYTVTSTGPIALTGTFSLATPFCSGSMFNFVRTYTYLAANEGFKVVDAANENVLLTVAANSGQENNVQMSYLICVNVDRIGVDFVDTTSYWYSGSYLHVNVMLDTEHVMTLGRVRKDNQLGLSVSSYYNSKFPVAPQQQWYYKMGEVSSGWSGSATDGWAQAVAGAFPVSTNKIQLYKKTFSVDSLANAAGFIIALKYKYGCVVMINDVEVYRMGVEGAVGNSAIVTNVYSDVIFRTVTLPTKTMEIGDSLSVTYLQQGSNTIAIALIALTDTQTVSVFDCVLNLMGENEMNRAYDMTTTHVGFNTFANAFDDYFSSQYTDNTCTDNTDTLIFNDDRREWISSIVIQTYYFELSSLPATFILEARNPEDEVWTELKTVSGLKWSVIGQSRRFWVINNKPFNQLRIRNVSTGDPLKCSWIINRIHLMSNSMTQNIPTLTIENTIAFLNIEMSEIYPSSDMYSDFIVTPILPTGINIDPHTGMIFGTATTLSSSKTYSISTKKATGGTATCTFTFGIEVCFGGKALMTVKIKMDSFPNENSYKLFSGRDTTSHPIAVSNLFLTSNTIYYLDRCLSNGIYTFIAEDSYGDGWFVPSGYSMSIDHGEMFYDMSMIPTVSTKPSIVSTVFSSYLPFQIENVNDWKVYTGIDTVTTDWKTPGFNEAGWNSVKAVNIGVSQAVTVYIRKSFTIPNLDDYQVLNVRMKFTGGAVVYFNGNKVARFNLAQTFDETTSGGPSRSIDSFVKFHVILSTSGVIVNGNNVIAIELHRAAGDSSVDRIVFDATGVFGVQDCSPVLDSFVSITSSTTLETTVAANAFELWPVNYLKLENTEAGHITWEVENQEGSRFNNYGIVGDTVTSLSFSLSARDLEAEEWIDISNNPSHNLVSRVNTRYESPVGLIGFRQFQWRRPVPSGNTFSIYAFITNYCKTTGAVCPGVGDYPAVTEGQISPAPCAYGYRGYSFRTCASGVLGEIDNTKCVYKIPENLKYSFARLEFVRDTMINTEAPTVDYIVTKFYIDDGYTLPEGLTIDHVTGIIHGTPTKELETKEYTIRAMNTKGSTFVIQYILVKIGSCKVDGVFPRSYVGTVAVHECSSQGSYIGSQKRTCVLGEVDGEWSKTSGFCMSIATIVITVIVVIIIIIVIVFIILRTTIKKKAVGGVKGKKSMKSSTTGKKQMSNKTVKV